MTSPISADEKNVSFSKSRHASGRQYVCPHRVWHKLFQNYVTMVAIDVRNATGNGLGGEIDFDMPHGQILKFV